MAPESPVRSNARATNWAVGITKFSGLARRLSSRPRSDAS